MSNIFNRFATNPVNIDIPRSKFDRSQRHKTTMNAGSLIPIYVEEVLPGDTHTLTTAMSVRMSTPIHPVMDDSFIDIYHFFVPNRLVWDHWEEFLGANKTGPWVQPVEYEVPQIKLMNQAPGAGSIADYFGIPLYIGSDGSTGTQEFFVNALPFRAYQLIWNEWFRDENLQTPVFIQKGDLTENFGADGFDVDYLSDGSEWWTDGPLNGPCYPVCKFPDYFTTALPMPQKGSPVDVIPDVALQLSATENLYHVEFPNFDNIPYIRTLDANKLEFDATNVVVGTNNLSLTVNELRTAFQVQKWLEKSARGGSRYIEFVKAHFGVSSSDARLQRPEYIGGSRSKITVMQVAQTSATNEVSPQGNVSAYSLTLDKSDDYTYSATEHGYIISVACIRTKQTYQYGLEKMWSRRSKFDFYDPVFANIGEQPILNKEIYATKSITPNPFVNEEVFGYQEAWAEYRYKPDRISGFFRSSVSGSLDVWHYAEDYDSLPVLNNKFIVQSDKPVMRSLAVQDGPQFLADFLIKDTTVRPMPMYSIPGFADHH